MLSKCEACKTSASAAHAEHCMAREAELARDVAEINAEIDALASGVSRPSADTLADLEHRLRTLDSPLLAVQHHLAVQVAEMLWEVVRVDATKGAAAARSCLAIVDTHVRLPSLAAAFKAEDLASCLSAPGMTCEALIEAATVQRRALRLLRTIAGEAHPYSQGAERRLAAILRRAPESMSAGAHALDVDACAFCGNSPQAAEGGLPVRLKVCGRCRRAQYCSGSCQKALWPMHRRECRATAS
jgi:hypothetical protein